MAYTYDAASNKKTVGFVATGATGYTVSNNYDTGERLSAILGGATTIASFGYDPLSRMSSTSYMDGSSIGYAYEADDDLQTLTNSYSGGSVVLGYTHNGAHQKVGMTITDSQYLMKQVGSNQTYAPNNLNQYTSVTGSTLTYDPNGNLLGDGVSAYSYDEENRLRQVVVGGVTSVYQYDPVGRRRSKTVGSTTTYFVSDGPNELAELGSTGSRLRLYVNANNMDSRVAVYDDGAGTGWSLYHPNHQGSILFTTRGNVVADKYHYGPFGEPLSTDAATGNAIRYTGRYFDAESGLYYYRARFYSAKLGRFLQTDPIGVKDDLNLYTYTGNDPLDGTDPSGMCDSPATGTHICPIVGKAQSTGTTGHAETSQRTANQMAQSGKYETVHLNQKLSTITGNPAAGGQQPDVAGAKPDGGVDTVEVPSKTQSVAAMDAKGAQMQEKLSSIGRGGGTPSTVPIEGAPKAGVGGKMGGAAELDVVITVAVGAYVFAHNPTSQGAKDAGAAMLGGVLCGFMGGCNPTGIGNAPDGLAR